jgi:hypothetical protein
MKDIEKDTVNGKTSHVHGLKELVSLKGSHHLQLTFLPNFSKWERLFFVVN